LCFLFGSGLSGLGKDGPVFNLKRADVVQCKELHHIRLFECCKDITGYFFCIPIENDVSVKPRHADAGVSHFLNNVTRCINVIGGEIFGMQGLPRVEGVSAIGMARGAMLIEQGFAPVSGLPRTTGYGQKTNARRQKEQSQSSVHMPFLLCIISHDS
jgi:hypothetical protein